MSADTDPLVEVHTALNALAQDGVLVVRSFTSGPGLTLFWFSADVDALGPLTGPLRLQGYLYTEPRASSDVNTVVNVYKNHGSAAGPDATVRLLQVCQGTTAIAALRTFSPWRRA